VKAFLLAAGQGTRLRPLTDHVPKCLVPIRGRPLLDIWLELLDRYAIGEVLVNLHAHAREVRDYLKGINHGLAIKFFEEPALLGSAGTIRANRDWVASELFFWVFYADVLTNARLDEMLAFHCSHDGLATLGVYVDSHPERCGTMLVNESGRITEFVEKPRTPRSHLAFSGLLIGTPALLDALPDSTPADLGFDVFPRLASRMFAFPVRDYLLDIGTHESYELAQNSWPGLPALTPQSK
jgi:mannose-1-phosphate guanylyltransferase